jgi:uncharacterized membrane protein YfcA
MFFIGGIITKGVIINTMWLVPSMVIGVVIGNIMASRISQAIFKKITLILIFASGVWTLIGLFK